MRSKNSDNGIILIETGGTVSTARENGYLAAGRVDLARAFPEIPFVRAEKPVTVLSENETFADINAICSCASAQAEYAEKNGLSGIIITHGTDSLAFFAAASALMLYDVKVPIVIVSADLPVSDEKSNARDNMLGAYEFIKSRPRGGVFVAYRNSGENVKLHYGARLNLSRGFDGYVSSAADKILGEISGGAFVSVNEVADRDLTYIENAPTVLPTERENKTRYVVPYVGLDYIALNEAATACGAEIMHDSFHSGTLKTSGENSVNALTVPVFAAGKAGGNSYESEKFLGGNVRVYKNIAPAALYFKLVLSRNLDAKNREKYLRANICNEYF